MDEIWKDVVGLEKWFEVSNKGRAVRQCGFSLNGIYSCCKGKLLTHHGFKFMYFDDYKKQENT